jgi:hypothetical protein
LAQELADLPRVLNGHVSLAQEPALGLQKRRQVLDQRGQVPAAIQHGRQVPLERVVELEVMAPEVSSPQSSVAASRSSGQK